jgi:hypothetical protein
MEGSSALVIACADGAGSASRAEVGAALACQTFVSVVEEALRGGLQVRDTNAQHVLAWYQQARHRLTSEANLQGAEARDYACTLLTAVLGEEEAIFAQIGDGAIVYRGGDGYQTAIWPQSGEEAGTTYFLTGEGFEEQLTVYSPAGKVVEVALFTDGLQPLALHYASRTVHGPFFDPMFEALRLSSDPASLEGPLRDFLSSEQVNERTDDDKTLVLATRHAPSNGSA